MANRPPVSYRRSIVTFFDILGFRELVANQAAANIESTVRALQDFSRSNEGPLGGTSFQFSDSVVRVLPLDSEVNVSTPVGVLFSEVLAIVHAQLEMANLGVFLRGGMTIGEVYWNGNV